MVLKIMLVVSLDGVAVVWHLMIERIIKVFLRLLAVFCVLMDAGSMGVFIL